MGEMTTQQQAEAADMYRLQSAVNHVSQNNVVAKSHHLHAHPHATTVKKEEDVAEHDDGVPESDASVSSDNSVVHSTTSISDIYQPMRRARRRPRRATVDLELSERWNCPKGCGKVYRKNSTVSIRKHVPFCQGPHTSPAYPKMNYAPAAPQFRFDMGAQQQQQQSEHPLPLTYAPSQPLVHAHPHFIPTAVTAAHNAHAHAAHAQMMAAHHHHAAGQVAAHHQHQQQVQMSHAYPTAMPPISPPVVPISAATQQQLMLRHQHLQHQLQMAMLQQEQVRLMQERQQIQMHMQMQSHSQAQQTQAQMTTTMQTTTQTIASHPPPPLSALHTLAAVSPPSTPMSQTSRILAPTAIIGGSAFTPVKRTA